MRVAITTNILRTPPNYFVTEHAQRLRDRHEFRVFALLADVRDGSVNVPIRDFAAPRSASYSVKRWFAPLAGRRLRDAVVDYAPRIVHQHFGTWSSPAIGASRRLGVPLVVTLHGYDVRSLSSRTANAMVAWHRSNVRAIASAASRVLSVSRYLADEAVAHGFDASKMFVHYQGVDTDFFTPGDGGSRVGEVPVVAFVGALEPHKGVLELAQASLALAPVREHRLVFAGTGSLRPALRELAREHRHIDVVGQLSRGEVRDVLRESAMLVLPSRPLKGGAEAAGLTLLEAQACGTPVIAFDVGGTSEMLRADETGLLLPGGDARALEAAIRDLLLLDGVERCAVSRRAREFVVASRSVERASEELDRHYADVVF